MYKQPIIVFGIVLPVLIAVVLIGACVFVKGKVSNSYESKTRNYEGYSITIENATRVEKELVKQREDSERWEELLSQEPFSLVTTNLRLIGEELPPKEFQRTAFERLGNSSGFGQVTSQKSTGMRFNLRGTYRAVQKALLELETRMPNLQLQSLVISPNEPSETSLLNFQVIYTVWEK